MVNRKQEIKFFKKLSMIRSLFLLESSMKEQAKGGRLKIREQTLFKKIKG